MLKKVNFVLKTHERKISDSLKKSLCSTGDINHTNVYIHRGKKIGWGGFSEVYKISIYQCDEMPSANMGNIGDIGNIIRNTPGVKKRDGALKYAPVNKKYGLESLMEMNIMKHLTHKCINAALSINIKPIIGDISFLQNLAIADASIIRKNSRKLSPKDLKIWIWCIVCGVAKMHSNGILHGDIKCGNILLFYIDEEGKRLVKGESGICEEFSNVECKLNDFSLSRLITDPDFGTIDTPGHTSYTSTHRPIEVWKSEKFSFSADMWALGCTIYELTYGAILFPPKRCINKAKEIEQNIKAIKEWDLLNLQPSIICDYDPIVVKKPRQEPIHGVIVPNEYKLLMIDDENTQDSLGSQRSPYKCFSADLEAETHYFNGSFELSKSAPQLLKSKVVPSSWYEHQNSEVNDIIIGLLNLNTFNRYTVWDLLEHEYFNDIKTVKVYSDMIPHVTKRCFTKIEYFLEGVSQTFMEEAKSAMLGDDVAYLATYLYQRANTIKTNKPKPSIKSCLRIAHKIINRSSPPSFGVIDDDEVNDEILLCQLLNYNFLQHIK